VSITGVTGVCFKFGFSQREPAFLASPKTFGDYLDISTFTTNKKTITKAFINLSWCVIF